jgi:hypothetical protein
MGRLATVGMASSIRFAEVTEVKTKLLAKRAAEADAIARLPKPSKGFKSIRNTYVRDFVTKSDTIRAELGRVHRGVRLGKPKWLDDGRAKSRRR